MPAGAGLYGGLALPALETLLARGRSSDLPGASLERWLAAAFRIAARPDLPLAALSLRGEGVDPGDAFWLRADPVHLSVQRDQLLLTDAGHASSSPPARRRELTGALNAHFAEDGLEFIAPTPQRWYVRARDEPRVRTTPTAEAIGGSIEALLPQGDDGPRWRRIVNEAQMLLHAHPCNEAREARGELPVNSIWLWGAGRLPEIPDAAPYGAVWSSHPLAAGIAAGAGLASQHVPSSAARFLEAATGSTGGKPHSLVLRRLARGACRRPGRVAGCASGTGSVLVRAAARCAEGRRALVADASCAGSGHGRTVTATRFDPLKFWRRSARWATMPLDPCMSGNPAITARNVPPECVERLAGERRAPPARARLRCARRHRSRSRSRSDFAHLAPPESMLNLGDDGAHAGRRDRRAESAC